MNFPARRKPFALLFCYGCVGLLAGTFAAEVLAQTPVPLRVDPVLLGLPPIKPSEAPAPAPVSVPDEKARAEVKPVEESVVEMHPVPSPGQDERELHKHANTEEPAPAPVTPASSATLPAPAPKPDPTPSAAALPTTPNAKNNGSEAQNSSISERQPAKESMASPPVSPATPPVPEPKPDPRPSAAALPASPAAKNNRSEAQSSSTPEKQPAKEPIAGSAVSVPTPVAKPEQKATAAASTVTASVATKSTAAGSVSSLTPLRVDPALLGQAPAVPAAAPAESAVASTPASAPRPARQGIPDNPASDVAPKLAAGPAIRPTQVPTDGPRDAQEVPDALPALSLRSSKKLEPLADDNSEPRPTFLMAQRMGGLVDREFVAEGDAELRKIGTVLNADRMTYWPLDDEIEAESHVRLEQGDDLMTGPKMRLKLEDQIGYFDQPSYLIKRQPPITNSAADERLAELMQKGGGDWLNAGFESPKVLNIKPGQTKFDDSPKKAGAATATRGDADRLDFEGKNQFRLTNATFTTCKPDNDDWYGKTSELKLDYDREVGNAKDATIYFKDVPILYSPWLSFSLNNQRKSGFLAPSFGTSTDSGVELAIPYYWNIAPNMDATITPHIMSKRGVLVSNDFRYLNTAYGGLYQDHARLEVLPGDNVRDGRNRWGISLTHTQNTANGFSSQINFNRVSDDDYYTDLSSGIASTSTTQLLQQGVFSYNGGGWWNASAKLEQYQTLQPDPKNPVREPYRILPQLTLNARKPDLYGTDSSFLGQFTYFTRSDQIINGTMYNGDSGQRTVLYPQVAVPFVTPGWYVTPKLGLNIRHYNLSGQSADTPGSINTTLPIASIDSGMVFERPSNWFGRDYTQTLEPRLYYLNIPYKDQSDIPRFDTELADFNFAQIFSENQFSSWDRINSANQLTAAATSRLLEPETGNEIMRVMLGQRYYFSPNRVGLDSAIDKTDKWDRSDVLAAFSGQVLPKVYADSALQYNVSGRQVKRYSIGAHYQPEPGKVLNASYRYYRDTSAPVDQVDVTGQWPLSGRWHAVGRLNYSFKDDATNLSNSRQGGRVIESLAGLEYNAGCWVLRGVIKRTALTEDRASSSFFIQLELTDFGQIGSNPLNLLKRNIQGYSQINSSEQDSILGD